MRLLLAILLCTTLTAEAQINRSRFMRQSATSSEIPGIFVDSFAGSDSNTGTSNSPWATSAKVESVLGAYAVTNIYAKRGSTLKQFKIPGGATLESYGTADYAPNVYGGVTNSKAVFTGAIRLTNANFTLTAGKTNTYQIDLTGLIGPVTNTLASVTSSNVLMVWQNNTMLAGWTVSASPSYAYNANTVDAGTGRFFYDVSTKILYVSATNQSSIITNGDFFEASVSTYALIAAGTNNTVRSVIAEKAFAYNNTGRQGYAVYAGGGSTYYKVAARYGWNHVIGIAAGENFNLLTFDSCYGLGMKTDAGGGATTFVAFSSGNATSFVNVTNCLMAESVADTVNDSYGYYGHDAGGGTVSVCLSVQNSVAYNMDNGFVTYLAGRNTNWSGNTAVNCKSGYLIAGPEPVRNFTNYWATVATGRGVEFVSSSRAPVYNSKFIFTNAAIGVFTTTSDAVNVTNSVFANNGTRAGTAHSGQGGGTTAWHSWSNSFYNVTYGYINGTMTSGDYNNYSTLFRLGEDMTVAPGFWSQANFATWQSAWSPIDANSTTSDPGYGAGFYTYTVTDPTGGDAN